jgi:DNA-binding response OmpR family regulator
MSHRILMIENDKDDRFLTEEMFAMQDFHPQLQFIYSNEFHDYIGRMETAPTLILLTPHSGIPDPLQILSAIRKHESLMMVPVIVLCNSADRSLTVECYNKGANTVITKPAGLEQTAFKIRTFVDYWFRIAELPQPAGTPSA